MANQPKLKRTNKRREPLASAGSTQPEKKEAAAVMQLARHTSLLAVGVFAVFCVYCVYHRYLDNSTVLTSPVVSYAFPMIAVSLLLMIYQRILRTGPPFPFARIELVSKANTALAMFVVLLGITSILFTKAYTSAIQTQLFVVGTLAVLALIAAVLGNLTYDILKSRCLQQ
jgi:hypothetical protein